MSQRGMEDLDIECCVSELQLCGASILCATPIGVAYFMRDSFALMDIDFFAGIGGVTVASPSGSGVRLSWFPFSLSIRVTHCITDVAAAVRQAEAVSSLNMVQCNRPLPEAFLSPVQIRRDTVDPKATKPVTFGRPIKSSGYSSASAQPWSVQQAIKKATKAKLQRHPSPKCTPQFDMSAGPPAVECAKMNATLATAPVHSGAILSLCFDATGSSCISSSTDGTLNMLKVPVGSKCDSIMIQGHKTMIQSHDCSLHLQHPLVATGAFDGSVALWRPTKRETPYLSHDTGKEVKSVKFYFMDKLLVTAFGGNFAFFKWACDEGGGDLDRKRNDSKITEVRRVVTGSQQVNAVDCFNSFTSNVVLWAGSNKQIGIYDVAADAHARIIEDAHARSIHSIEMLRSSRYACLPSESLHFFATASLDKTVRLWDLRQEKPFRTLSGHSNSAVKVGLCWSPCSKYVIVGSEDRAAYIFDVASGAVLERLVMGDTVTAARMHPAVPMVVLGASSGQMKLFNSK